MSSQSNPYSSYARAVLFGDANSSYNFYPHPPSSLSRCRTYPVHTLAQFHPLQEHPDLSLYSALQTGFQSRPYMPGPGDETAPRFDGHPRSLLRFFDEIEVLGKLSDISPSEQIRYTLRYLNMKEYEIWKSRPSAAGGNWIRFKRDIIHLYPGADDDEIEPELEDIKLFLTDPSQPLGLSKEGLERLIRLASEFFVREGVLWKKDSKGHHKQVVPMAQRAFLVRQVHSDLGHKGIFMVRLRLSAQFWWPTLDLDVRSLIEPCKECQAQRRLPPFAPTPLLLFRKVYIDGVLMPKSNGYNYIIHARCSLSCYPEWRVLCVEDARDHDEFIFEDILCRWGAVEEIITDNGPTLSKAVDYLATKYKINHIPIFPRNDQTNDPVHRRNFDLREALFRAAEGDVLRWAIVAPSVFWAERVTIHKSTGHSPYYLAHGQEPLLPFDLAEATFLTPAWSKPTSTIDLIVNRAIQFRKRPQDLARVKEEVFKAGYRSVDHFNREFLLTIRHLNFQEGSLVLVGTSHYDIENTIPARYFGPMVVLHRTKGRSYILCELDGSISKPRFAASRLVPYHPHHIPVIPIIQLTNATPAQLEAMTYDPQGVGNHPNDDSGRLGNQ